MLHLRLDCDLESAQTSEPYLVLAPGLDHIRGDQQF